MHLTCPYCSATITGKAAKPGRYTPSCPGCGKSFVVVVPAAAGQAPDVAALPASELPDTVIPMAPLSAPEATGSDEQPVLGLAATDEYVPPPVLGAATVHDQGKPGEILPLTQAIPGLTAAERVRQAAGPRLSSKTTARVPKRAVEYRVPALLGGFQTVKELGRGGMGAVFLARQLSLDRRVALKVMSPVYAADAGFVARFVREAYAAAQLTHHNIVQIYDIGTDHGWNYLSMEYVQGPSLGEILRQEGKLAPEVAVGYILQAARGLKYAHDMGMVHRDIKPDNLLVNEQGVVKVTDLGLVKIGNLAELTMVDQATPSALAAAATTDITQADITLGTPAYMAPEQARNVSGVDPRADIYSLGCTLYVLLTGKPPFEGKTVMEIITKHATVPVTPPEVMVKSVPKALSTILLKMMAKKPEERYADMAEVIQALEAYLASQHAGAFQPGPKQAEQLEAAVQAFNRAGRAPWRTPLLLGFGGVCALLCITFLLLGLPVAAGAAGGLGLLTGLAYFIVHGLTHRTYLFGKVRELVLGSRLTDWLIGAGVFLLGLLLLFFLELLWLGFGIGLLALGLALGFHVAIDRPTARQRAGAVAQAEKVVRNLRLHGLEEEALRHFIAQYAGRQWEEFYETLFGYEAMRQAREWCQVEGGPAPEHFGAWREPILRWIDARLQARHEAKEKEHLQAVEEQNLRAQGVEPTEARVKAEQAAERLVNQAAVLKVAPPTSKEVEERADRRRRVQEMLDLNEWEPVTLRHRNSRIQLWFDRLFNARIRFLLGSLLLTGWLGWMWQNQLLPTSSLQKAIQTGDMAHIAKVNDDLSHTAARSERPTKPLVIPMVPETVTAWFDSYNPGVAGLLLVISAFTYGWIMSLWVLLGVLLICFGHKVGIPDLGPFSANQVSLTAGGLLALVGFLVGRSK